jgi:hypothetical protein
LTARCPAWMARIAPAASLTTSLVKGSSAACVKVVHAPDQAPFDVPPRTEIFDMQVTHAKHSWGSVQMGTDLGPELHPAVKGSAQKGERGFSHTPVFQLEIELHQLSVRAQPMFVLAS